MMGTVEGPHTSDSATAGTVDPLPTSSLINPRAYPMAHSSAERAAQFASTGRRAASRTHRQQTWAFPQASAETYASTSRYRVNRKQNRAFPQASAETFASAFRYGASRKPPTTIPRPAPDHRVAPTQRFNGDKRENGTLHRG